MKDAPKSGTRAVSVAARVRDVAETLRTHRTRLASMLAETDAVLADVELLEASVAELERAAGDTADAPERAHLAAHGARGLIVLRIARERGVGLRHLLGPGAPMSARVANARAAAAVALRDNGVGPTATGEVLRLTQQAVSKLLGRAAARAGKAAA